MVNLSIILISDGSIHDDAVASDKVSETRIIHGNFSILSMVLQLQFQTVPRKTLGTK